MNGSNLDRRKFLELLTASAACARFHGCACLGEIGKAYVGWHPGEMDLHFIYTGCGENMFYRLPDGTAILNDVGDFYRPCYLNQIPLLPSSARLGGDWVARYLQRIYPERVIDYAIFSHWHADHIGHANFAGDGSGGSDPSGAYRYRVTPDGRKINGFMCVAERFKFARYFDSQYPKRGTYGSADSSIRLLAPWADEAQRRGMVVESFKVGALNQIALLREPNGYRGMFSIRNICANGKLWMGGDEVRDFAAEHVAASGEKVISQNLLSLGFVIRYGKFRYWAGGDVLGRLKARDGSEVNYEGEVGRRVGPVSVCKMNHHGFHDAMDREFVEAVRAQAYVSCIWTPNQATPEVLTRLAQAGSHDGKHSLLLPTLVFDEIRRNSGADSYSLDSTDASHVIVKVLPGGNRYRIYLIDAADEEMRVKAIFERDA